MVHLKLQLLLLIITMKQLSNAVQQKLLLSVYYESNCPDSKTFILKQLVPTMNLLHDYVQIKFIPFGKSRSINYGDSGFECQHGPSECQGNLMQECSLYLMKGQSDMKKLEYVACEMETQAGSLGTFDCVLKSKLPYKEVDKCMMLGKGTILQLESEYYTSLVSPKFIPTVTVNGIFDKRIQDSTQIDLFGTICAMVPDVEPCAQYYNYLALNHLLEAPVNPQ